MSNWPEELTVAVSIFLAVSLFLLVNLASVQAASWTANDFFVRLIENEADLASGYAVFEIRNPTNTDITITANMLKSRYVHAVGSTIDKWDFYVLRNVSYSKNMTDYSWDGITGHRPQPSGWHWNNYTREEFVQFQFPATFKKGSSFIIKVVGHYDKARLGLTANDWLFGLNVSGNYYERSDWAWWNSSWNYKKAINVSLGQNVSYYQLYLDIAKDGNMTSDFSDIRFVNSTENGELPYWIDDYNSTGAKVFVNVTLSSLNGTQLYMYYGNTTPVSSRSNGVATFAFFDDFETNDLSKWDTTSGAATTGVQKYHGSYSALITGNSLIKTVNASSTGVGQLMGFSHYHDSSASDNYFGFEDSTGGQYAVLGKSNGASAVNYTGVLNSGWAVTRKAFEIDTWKKIQVKSGLAGSHSYILSNYSQILDSTKVVSANRLFGDEYGTVNLYVDDVYAAKWINPEPVIAFGSVQSQSSPAVNDAPQWSNNITSQASGQTYLAARNYGFQITAVSNLTAVNFCSNITGSSKCYNTTTTPAVSNSSNIYSLNFTAIPAGTSWYYWNITNSTGTNSTASQNYLINRNSSSVFIAPLSAITYPATSYTGCYASINENSSSSNSITGGTFVHNVEFTSTSAYRIKNGMPSTICDITASVGFGTTIGGSAAYMYLYLDNQYIGFAYDLWDGIQAKSIRNSSCYTVTSGNFSMVFTAVGTKGGSKDSDLGDWDSGDLQSFSSGDGYFSLDITYMDNGGSLTLYRNGTTVNIAHKLVNDSTSLGAGVYNYSCTRQASQNYSSSSLLSQYLTVNPASSSISLYLNGTGADRTYSVGSVANFTALTTSGFIVNMTSNYTGFKTLGGTTSIINYTALNNGTATSATYNLTAWVPATANYSSSSVTYYFTVTNSSLTILNTTYTANVIEGPANNLFYEAWVEGGSGTDKINGSFIFNGTVFNVTNIANFSSTLYRLNISLTGWVNSTAASVLNESSPFYWSVSNYNLTGSLLSTGNSSSTNQTIHKIYLGNCSDGRSGQETLHFYLYDEEDMSTPINGTITPNFGDVSYQLGSYKNRTYSFSFANYTNKGICLYPTWANYYKTLSSNVIVYYTATNYDSRYYYFNPNMTNSSQTVNLYLLSTAGSAVTSIYVYDTDGTPYEDATVDVQRYLTSNGSYVSVGQITTDFDGKGVIYLVPNTVYYRFIVKNSAGTVLRTFSSKIITCSPSDYTCPPYTVVLDLSLGQGVSDWFRYYDFQYTCTNTTTAIACSVVTTSGVMANTSLRVDNVTTGLPICIRNSTSASVTHTCTVGNMTNNAYQYYLYGYVSSSSQWVLLYQNFLEGPEWVNSSAQSLDWGEWGLFLVIIMNLLLFLIGIWIPYVPNVLAIIGNIGMYAVGIFEISVAGIIAFTFIQVIVIYLMSRLK